MTDEEMVIVRRDGVIMRQTMNLRFVLTKGGRQVLQQQWLSECGDHEDWRNTPIVGVVD